MRMLDTMDNQVRSLRRRHVIASYDDGSRDGCYCGIRIDAVAYGNADAPLRTRSRDPSPLAANPGPAEAWAAPFAG